MPLSPSRDPGTQQYTPPLTRNITMSTHISGRLLRKIFPGFVPLALLLLVSIGMRPAAFAQSAGTASIQGTISDSTGAVIPNATVTLTNTETSTARTTVSDGSGV